MIEGTCIKGEDAKRHQDMLNHLAYLYMQLLRNDFVYTTIDVPRTNTPQDTVSVCQISFTEDNGTVNVGVTVTENTFTADEIYMFMARAGAVMKGTLKLYDASSTVH